MSKAVEHHYRGMTPAEIEAHEDWVRRFTASDAGKAAAAYREADRIRRERVRQIEEMSDEEVLAEAIAIVQRGDDLGAGVIFLRQAGFEREA